MKPIHLNLASRPYRNDTPMNAAIATLVLLTAILAYFNIDAYLRYLGETTTTRSKIAQLKTQTAEEIRRRQSADAWVKTVNLAALNSETRFINTQLAQRAFSWSELLDRMEAVLPDDVRVHGVTPAFDKTGLVRLDLMCDSKTAEGLIETINRLNADPHFANAFPTNDTSDASGHRFALQVDYRPTLARVTE